MCWPCETRTSTCRNFATTSGLYRFLAIAVLLDVKDIPQVGPLQWGRITVSKEIVEVWKAQVTDRADRRARRAPERVDPSTYSPFDPKTGEPRIWYHRSAGGEWSAGGDYEFYNLPGYDPQTGEELLVITRDVLDEWQKSQAEKAGKRCYIITQDGVRYSDKPGIDQVTGRQCRELTDQLIERLREYEKGRRPTKIVRTIRRFSIWPQVSRSSGISKPLRVKLNFLT
jgi:hypothetical protein